MPSRKRLIVGAIAFVAAAFALNWLYQIARKPAELLFPVGGALAKTPGETWQQYAPIFREHSTAVMAPELLAALAQIEGAGNPLARTPWRWRATHDPRELYRPASTAVGMYQITDGTFREARRYCIRNHAVLEEGPWHQWQSCWLNGLYMRIIPSHAIEMTSAYLDRRVSAVLARHRIAAATLEQKQDLAALIHLCGVGAGDAYARRGLRVGTGPGWGGNAVRGSLARVIELKRVFARLSGLW
jgi:hypothetical protein